MANLNTAPPDTPPETPTDDTPPVVEELSDTPIVNEPVAEEAPASPEAPPSEPAPTETPPSTEPPVAEPPPPAEPPAPQAPDPALMAREQALTQREQAAAAQEAEFQRTRQLGQIDNDLRSRTAELERSGLQPEQVSSIVERERGLRMEVLQAQQSAQVEAQTLRGQHNAALHYSNEYGIPFNDIASMSTPGEMEAAGKAFKANQTSTDEIAKLKTQVAELKQDKVPSGQVFEPGTPGSADEMTDEQVVAAYGDPNGDFNDHTRYAEAAARLGYT